MRMQDGTILMDGDLEHRAPYDPKKAHDYYLRTRELKGRKGATAQPTVGRGPGRIQPGRHTVGKAQIKRNPAKLAAQRKVARAQVVSLQKKLAELQDALKAKMSEERKSARTALSKVAKSAKDAAKPDTAAEKSEKAREAKKYRDKHKQELKTEAKKDTASSGGSSSGSKSEPKSAAKSAGGSVKEIKAAIAGVKTALAAAKARQRALG